MADTDTAVSQVNSRLEAENSRLNRKLQSYKEEAGRRKTALESATKELETLKTQVGTLTTERDQFKAQAEAGPQGTQEELAKLRAEVSAGRHKTAWQQAMADQELGLIGGVSPEKMWALMGVQPEGEPDPAAIKAALVAQKTKGDMPFLFAAPQGGTTAPQGAPTDPQGANGNGKGIQVGAAGPGPGAGRTAPQHEPVDEATRLAAYHSSKGRVVSAASTKI